MVEEETKRALRRPLARKEKVDVFVGGGLDGTRLGDLYAASVPRKRLVERLDPLLEESLGDSYHRCLRRAGRRDLLSGANGAGAVAPSARAETAP